GLRLSDGPAQAGRSRRPRRAAGDRRVPPPRARQRGFPAPEAAQGHGARRQARPKIRRGLLQVLTGSTVGSAHRGYGARRGLAAAGVQWSRRVPALAASHRRERAATARGLSRRETRRSAKTAPLGRERAAALPPARAAPALPCPCLRKRRPFATAAAHTVF